MIGLIMTSFLRCKLVAHLLRSEKASQQKAEQNFLHVFGQFVFLGIKLKGNN